MYRPPAAVVALRPFTLAGVAVARGARLTPAHLKNRNINVLLSKGYLATLPDIYGRRGRIRPRPAYLSPDTLADYKAVLGATLTATKNVTVPMQYDFVFAGTGFTPVSVWVNYGDGRSETKSTLTFSHTYSVAGTYSVSAVGWDANESAGSATATATPTATQENPEATEGSSRSTRKTKVTRKSDDDD